MAAATFYFEDSDSGGVIVTANLADADSAARIRATVQSIAGTRLERDGGFLYTLINASQVAEAADDLRGEGFDVDLSLCTPVTPDSEIRRLRAEVAQLRADRAVLLCVAVVAYGAEVLPVDPEEGGRTMSTLLGQMPPQPADAQASDVIREILVRVAAEAPPDK